MFKIVNIRQLLKQILNRYGLQLMKISTIDKYLAFYPDVIEKQNSLVCEDIVDVIVFSKDRAMQLFAFIESYNQMVSNKGRLFIIYLASNSKHEQSYEELIKSCSNLNVEFIKETNFRNQLLEVCEQSQSKKIGFFVDDMIFLKNIDLHEINAIDSFKYIVSLSRGKDLDYSVVLGKKLSLPTFLPKIGSFECFKWNEFPELNDWNYPLGVSGYFYNRSEVLVMLNNLMFKAPNSLEAQMQFYLPLFKNRFGLCHEQISCVCVHANIVQTECVNKTIGTFDIEELLNLWLEGYKIDVSKFYDKLGGDAQFQTYEFLKR